ncbi:response regulator [Fibrobacterota bacterium]
MKNPGKQGCRKTVFIVEDEAFTALMLQSELEEMGHEVPDPFCTGEDAVKQALVQNPDLVILDLDLAGELDGIETACDIMASCTASFIFITGYADGAERASAAEIKPLAFFEKPIDVGELKSVIKRKFEGA